MNDSLLKNNYVIIPNFISYHKAISLAEEFSQYAKNNNLGGDSQAENSHCSYNYISFLEILCEKTSEVSSILEETVIPTYSYARVYKNGSVLEKHKDRDACEISLTVHLNGDEVWPIWIETPNGENRSIILNPGDAVMYFGCDAVHWREKYLGNEYSQVFFHYVRSRGERFYAYFDSDKPNKEQSQICEVKKEECENNDNEIEFQLITSNSKEKEENNNSNLTSSPTIIVARSQAKLEDFIHVFDDVMPEYICDSIINEYKNKSEWRDTVTAIGIDKSFRNCEEIPMSSEEIISKNYDIRKSLDESTFISVSNILNRYRDIHPTFDIEIDTGYRILKYEEGEYYKEHTDSFKSEQRAVSCSIQLNEDYDGGEFAFFGREIMIRSKKGSAIVFPSNFMYPHEIMPVIRGTRYSIITWLV